MSDDDVRVRSDERRRLLNEFEVERNQLIRNIETCRIRDIDRPFIGDWSLKDIVGHVASWEAEYVAAIRDIRAGQPLPGHLLDERQHDHWNADHVERKRLLNFWSVYEQLRGGRQRLVDELEQVSDDDLTDESQDYVRVVRAATDHDREHWHHIAAVLAGMAGVQKSTPTNE